MKRLASTLCMLSFTGLSASCGSNVSSVGCEWFAGDNCWKDLFPGAGACAHPREDPATLAGDGKSCAFEDGTEVLLGSPVLPSDLDSGDWLDTYVWSFEIRKDDQPCLAYSEPLTLTTSAGTFRMSGTLSSTTITCQDGSQVSAPSVFDMMECEDILAILPSHTAYWTPGALGFALNGGPEGELELFWCERATP